MSGSVNGWVDKSMNEWIDVWVNGRMGGCGWVNG